MLLRCSYSVLVILLCILASYGLVVQLGRLRASALLSNVPLLGCYCTDFQPDANLRSLHWFQGRDKVILRTVGGQPIEHKRRSLRRLDTSAATDAEDHRDDATNNIIQGTALAKPTSTGGNGLRIMGGKVKGKKLESPSVHLRPMMAKVREALFSSLQSMQLLEGSHVRVVDMFAGSGSVGLEALSRGASHATFVDLSAECTSTALRNAAHCGFQGSATAITASALDVLRTPQQYGLRGTYDLISLTPPYEQISYPDLLEAVCSTPLLGESTVVVLEYPTEMGNLPYILGGDKLFGVRNRRYGRTVLAIYVHRPTGGFDLRPREFAPV